MHSSRNELWRSGVAGPEIGWELRKAPRPTKHWADVAWLPEVRHQASLKAKRVIGAPDFVLELLSPSNTSVESNRLRDLCLANGCTEIWFVDPESRNVQVHQAGSNIITVYNHADTIPKNPLGIGPIKVSDMFESIVPEPEKA